MPRYRVNHDYASDGHGPWTKGSEVEATDDEAAWVNSDSPGTLSPARGDKPAAKPDKAPAKKAETALSTENTPGLTKG